MANISEVENVQKDLESSLTQRMAEFEKRLKAASSPTNPTLMQLRDEFYSFKDLVSSMFSLLRRQIRDCAISVDAINMRHRQKALLFHGIAESTDINERSEVLQILHTRLGLPHIDDSSFKQCHRLGVKQSGRARPILVHFDSHHIKTEVWKAKSKLKGSAFSLCEFLTRERQSIHRNARRHFGMMNVWTFDGAIYIKHSAGREKIFTEEELDVLIAKYPIDPSSKRPGNATRTVDKSMESIKAMQTQQSPSGSSRQQESVRSGQPSSAPHNGDIKRSRRFVTKK